ncbi:4Fe-4S dicluster domain-containing protein [Patescibacteria group bacterium]|nr:4Fe-4S dicluster domain-containing protein [Patescibacteria group bacterium]
MLVIEKNKIEELVKELAKKTNLVDVRKDVLPFKQYFFSPSEETFSFDKNKSKIAPTKKEKEFVVFGLNLRDTEALVQLDEIMKRPQEDSFYFQKRNKATIISIINERGHMPHVGIDLIIERISNNEYKALALTKKGRKITENNFFKERKINSDSTEIKKDETSELGKMLLNPELLRDVITWSWKNYPKIWGELGEKCLGCGICTYVCPLCHCFSMEDTCELTGAKCSRTRKWTACTLPEFAQITGGHDFHPTIKERYYNWFYHKFVRAYNEHGKSQCVACGRCKKHCPAGIDIEKVLLEIVNNFQKSSQ